MILNSKNGLKVNTQGKNSISNQSTYTCCQTLTLTTSKSSNLLASTHAPINHPHALSLVKPMYTAHALFPQESNSLLILIKHAPCFYSSMSSTTSTHTLLQETLIYLAYKPSKIYFESEGQTVLLLFYLVCDEKLQYYISLYLLCSYYDLIKSIYFINIAQC